MVDEIDRQLERDQALEEANLNMIREQAAKIPAGRPGICDLCGEDSPRLVKGACARCRDKHGLP